MADKINVIDDPRVQRCTAQVNGRTYGYLLGEPKNGEWKATIFLIHGFPDLSVTWRYQIPMLIELGLRVVCPDCIGYGRTDAPYAIEEYTLMKTADDIKELARQLGTSKIIIGGHDWGGAVIYRTALWHPDLVTHIFSICTPFSPPHAEYTDPQTLVRTRIPHFAYQLQFAGPDLEPRIKTLEEVRQFLLALYGGRTSDAGEVGFDVKKGVLIEKLGRLERRVGGRGALLSEEELGFYVTEFGRNGVRGPLNWYRTSKLNHTDELSILDRTTLPQPVLFITATKDGALPPSMSRNMEKVIPRLTRAEVDADHWAHWQKPEECNRIIRGWVEQVVLGGKSRL